MLKTLSPILVLLAVACDSTPSPHLQQTQLPVVYGEDDRREVYAHPDEALREMARRSIASLLDLDRIDRSDPEGFTFGERILGPSLNLCEGQRFADQVRAGGCSSTLIGPRTMLTAGHCIDAGDCLEHAFVFDRFYRAEGELEAVTAEDVYRCRRLLAWQDDDESDFAVVELDRRVTLDRVPVSVAAIEPLPVDTPLTMIGFPNGIPAKIDTGGRVVGSGEAPWRRLEATVDAFGGNSGSGIFNADGQLVAILEGGRRDYTDEGECQVVNRLPDDVDDAENLVYVGRALDALCAAEPFHVLCEPPFEGASWCDTCADAADCRAGWMCDGTCRPPCERDDQCRSDHQCIDGICKPQTRMECRSATVWAVPACEPSYQQNACEAGEICVDGACREPLPGDQCDLAFEIAAESAVHRGQTGGGIQNTYEGDCGGEGPEVVYTFTLEAPARFSAGATGFDTLLYLRRDCDPEQEIACNDDRDDDNRSALIQAELDAGTYHLFVDGYRRAGEYELTVDFQPPCEVECEPGTQRCTEAGLSTCEAGPDGCPQWGEAAPCGDAERCVEDACVSIPEGDSCADAIRLPAEPVVIEGNLSAHTSTYAGTCGGIGPDRTYRFDLEQTTRLLARLEGDQPVFTLHQECPIVESRICSFNQNPLEFNVLLRPGTHYLIVDSRSADAGAFTLTFDFVVECPDCEDGGMPDAGVEDAGLPDSQVVDAAPADMGLPDVQVPVDAARPDMPQLDARPVDAASEDARVMPDATADSGPPPNAIVSSDGCHATPAGGSSWALLGMLLWAARRRRSMS